MVIPTQHSEETDPTELRKALKRNVIDPVFEAEGGTVADDLELYVNPTGRFVVVGGPMGDARLLAARSSLTPMAVWGVTVAAPFRARTAPR